MSKASKRREKMERRAAEADARAAARAAAPAVLKLSDCLGPPPREATIEEVIASTPDGFVTLAALAAAARRSFP